MQRRYSAFDEYTPSKTYEDYFGAQKTLSLAGKTDEEFTWSNDEIDKFLPKELRLAKQ